MKKKLEKKSSIISLVSYAGIKSLDLKYLRQFFSKNNINIKVIKNSLARKVLKKIGYDVLVDNISGQVLVISGNDIFATILAIEQIKKNNDKFIVQNTSLNNSIVSSEFIKSLLSFGNKSNIFLKLALVLKSPLVKIRDTLNLPSFTFFELIKLIENKKRGI